MPGSPPFSSETMQSLDALVPRHGGDGDQINILIEIDLTEAFIHDE
jgi:hypothetical protein